MTQRTIAQARQILEDATPTLNQPTYNALKAELDQAEATARQSAGETITRTQATFLSLRDELLEEACSVRDEQQNLAARFELGDLSAAEYLELFESIEARKVVLEQRSGRMAESQSFVAQVEEDPVGWVDQNIYAKFPEVRPEFTF